jgi:hypothetical protein
MDALAAQQPGYAVLVTALAKIAEVQREIALARDAATTTCM